MTVRRAAPADVEAMVRLAAQKREQYRRYAPLFYRPALNAMEVHRTWFRELVEDDETATLVHEDDEGAADGFLIGRLVPAPPVYDPGGLTCSVDDFVVAEPSQWATVGADLLWEVQRWAQTRGAVQTVVVCGPHDAPKRKMLLEVGLEVVSEWFTVPLNA